MSTKEYVIQKVRSMPEDIVVQIRDFIDFLESRRKNNQWLWLKENPERLHDDSSNYLSNLEAYEEMLAKGAIKWK